MTDTDQGRQVQGVFVSYRRTVDRGGEQVVGLASRARGAFITDFAPGEEERLDRLGALVPRGTERDPEKLEAVLLDRAVQRALNPLDVTTQDVGAVPSVTAPGLGQSPVGSFTAGDTGLDPTDPANRPLATGGSTSDGGLVRSDAPDVEDTAALAEFITSERLTAPETVALAEDDPERAGHVLAAEQQARGGDPRATVVQPLQKIIDQDAGQ